MKLGNIISQHDLRDYEQFNVYRTIDEVNNDLPTLVVGFTNAKKLFPDFDVENRQIDTKTFWTLSIREKREIHTEDLERFRMFCYKQITNDIIYIYIDPFNRTTKEIKKIIKRLQTTEELVAYKNNNMIYMLSENIIFGLNLDVLDFLEINTDKLINRIKDKSSVFLNDKEILIEYVKDMEYLNNDIKYIPLLYSINNEN
jgi:hypothetical protein